MGIVPGRSTSSLDLTEMTPVERMEQSRAKRERDRLWRNWALGVGAVLFVAALIVRPLSVELGCASFAVLSAAAFFHGLSRREHGEV